jgi:hypothetical protein
MHCGAHFLAQYIYRCYVAHVDGHDHYLTSQHAKDHLLHLADRSLIVVPLPSNKSDASSSSHTIMHMPYSTNRPAHETKTPKN